MFVYNCRASYAICNTLANCCVVLSYFEATATEVLSSFINTYMAVSMVSRLLALYPNRPEKKKQIKNTQTSSIAVSSAPFITTIRTHMYLLRPSRVPAIQKTTKGMRDIVIPDPNCTIITVVTGDGEDNDAKVIGFVTEWINAYTFVSRK